MTSAQADAECQQQQQQPKSSQQKERQEKQQPFEVDADFKKELEACVQFSYVGSPMHFIYGKGESFMNFTGYLASVSADLLIVNHCSLYNASNSNDNSNNNNPNQTTSIAVLAEQRRQQEEQEEQARHTPDHEQQQTSSTTAPDSSGGNNNDSHNNNHAKKPTAAERLSRLPNISLSKKNLTAVDPMLDDNTFTAATTLKRRNGDYDDNLDLKMFARRAIIHFTLGIWTPCSVSAFSTSSSSPSSPLPSSSSSPSASSPPSSLTLRELISEYLASCGYSPSTIKRRVRINNNGDNNNNDNNDDDQDIKPETLYENLKTSVKAAYRKERIREQARAAGILPLGANAEDMFNQLSDGDLRQMLRQSKSTLESYDGLIGTFSSLMNVALVSFFCYVFIMTSGLYSNFNEITLPLRITGIVFSSFALIFSFFAGFERSYLTDLKPEAWMWVLRYVLFVVTAITAVFAMVSSGIGLTGQKNVFTGLTIPEQYDRSVTDRSACDYFSLAECSGFERTCAQGQNCPVQCSSNNDFSTPCKSKIERQMVMFNEPALVMEGIALFLVCLSMGIHCYYSSQIHEIMELLRQPAAEYAERRLEAIERREIEREQQQQQQNGGATQQPTTTTAAPPTASAATAAAAASGGGEG